MENIIFIIAPFIGAWLVWTIMFSIFFIPMHLVGILMLMKNPYKNWSIPLQFSVAHFGTVLPMIVMPMILATVCAIALFVGITRRDQWLLEMTNR